jgi:ketosteroid isomerase-like protein
MIRLTAVAALLSVAVSTSAYAQCTEAEKASFEAMDKAWGDAGRNGDAGYLEKAYAPQYLTINPAGTIDKATTIANSVRNAERNKANPQPAGTSDYYVINCTPMTATIVHRNVSAVAAGSMAVPTYSRSIHFLEKRGNSWQVVSSLTHGLQDQAQLVYLEQDWNAAAKRHDGAWVAANYAPFASDISSRTGGIENREQAIASANDDKMVYESLDLSELNTRVEGDVALVTGVNRVKGKDAAGKAFDRRTRFTDTFIKRDGRWLVWATQGTLIQ